MASDRSIHWAYEDELEDDITDAQYSAMYPMSRLSEGTFGVRMFPYTIADDKRVYLTADPPAPVGPQEK